MAASEIQRRKTGRASSEIGTGGLPLNLALLGVNRMSTRPTILYRDTLDAAEQHADFAFFDQPERGRALHSVERSALYPSPSKILSALPQRLRREGQEAFVGCQDI